MADDPDTLEVRVDGQPWHVSSQYSEYDAIHAVAGALLAGAEEVEVERNPVDVGVSLKKVRVGVDRLGGDE